MTVKARVRGPAEPERPAGRRPGRPRGRATCDLLPGKRRGGRDLGGGGGGPPPAGSERPFVWEDIAKGARGGAGKRVRERRVKERKVWEDIAKGARAHSPSSVFFFPAKGRSLIDHAHALDGVWAGRRASRAVAGVALLGKNNVLNLTFRGVDLAKEETKKTKKKKKRSARRELPRIPGIPRAHLRHPQISTHNAHTIHWTGTHARTQNAFPHR